LNPEYALVRKTVKIVSVHLLNLLKKTRQEVIGELLPKNSA